MPVSLSGTSGISSSGSTPVVAAKQVQFNSLKSNVHYLEGWACSNAYGGTPLTFTLQPFSIYLLVVATSYQSGYGKWHWVFSLTTTENAVSINTNNAPSSYNITSSGLTVSFNQDSGKYGMTGHLYRWA